MTPRARVGKGSAGPGPGGAGCEGVRFNRGVSSDYRFSRALLVRSVGALLVLLGLLVLLLAVLVVAVDLPRGVLTAAVVAAGVLVVAAALTASRLSTVLSFDETGYRVRLLRGAGVRAARWREVEDAVTATIAGHECVVLRLKDGRTTTIPVDVLETSPAALLDELTRRLDRGHGYRRLS